MNDVPESYKHYFPSWQEWAIAMGSLAGALLIITFFARVYPIIPIQETINEENEKAEQL
jgi:molybdopterin-containing oxidoreductase family membrane subunit